MNKWIVIRYVVGVVRMIITRVLYARARVCECVYECDIIFGVSFKRFIAVQSER